MVEPSTRPFTLATIRVDPNAPDSKSHSVNKFRLCSITDSIHTSPLFFPNPETQLSIGIQGLDSGGSAAYTFSESHSVAVTFSLTIVRFPPEHDIEITINTQGISSNPAAAGMSVHAHTYTHSRHTHTYTHSRHTHTHTVEPSILHSRTFHYRFSI